MEGLIARWRNAARRAEEEQVRILSIDGAYRATSSSRPLGSYRLDRTVDGWTCECVANREYGMPCKHLWALAEALGLDVLADVRLDWAASDEPLAVVAR
ncbi:MAG: SWIM zinc finger family protein [Chloroflexi bacterium]|nr:SWIM zinc finger family protein [Chloroflexota bacterium]